MADESLIESDLPTLAAPARRALAGAGYERLEQIVGVGEAALLRLHGMGPKAIRQLREALADRGLSLVASALTTATRGTRGVGSGVAARSTVVATSSPPAVAQKIGPMPAMVRGEAAMLKAMKALSRGSPVAIFSTAPITVRRIASPASAAPTTSSCDSSPPHTSVTRWSVLPANMPSTIGSGRSPINRSPTPSSPSASRAAPATMLAPMSSDRLYWPPSGPVAAISASAGIDQPIAIGWR